MTTTPVYLQPIIETKPVKTLKIKCAFSTLALAVAWAKPGLSYNEHAARQKIDDLDTERGRGAVDRAFVTEDGDIWYIFSCDIRILHKFEPFHSMMSDSPFQVAFVTGSELCFTDTFVPKSREGRRWFATRGKECNALAA